jgi:hypothetical protein
MLQKITVVVLLIGSLLTVKDAFNNAQQAPAGYTGAPGEQTCATAGCHTGVVQVGSPSFNFSFFPAQNPRPELYVTNTIYNMQINFPIPPSPQSAGFLVVALDPNNNSVGTFINAGGNSNTDTFSLGGRDYIGHINAPTTPAWVFRWQAPSSYVGLVTFYAAALAGDGDVTVANDITYTDTIQFPPFGVSSNLDAGFTSNINSVCVNNVVTLSNTSTGTITGYQWDFGLGATPPTANTAGPHNVVYSTDGFKDIRLIITDGNSFDTAYHSVTVNPIPAVDAGQNREICNGQIVTLTATGAINYAWSNNQTGPSISVAPTINATYSVTGTANGCSATDNVTVTVNSTPNVALPPNVAICVGNSTVLDAGNPGANYLWSTQETSQTITVSSADTYAVTVTNVNGCSATGSTVVTVISALPVSLPDTSVICNGQIAVLDAGFPGSTYIWSTNATTQTISAFVEDDYSVTVTDVNGCTGTDAGYVKVNPRPVVTVDDETICNTQSVTLDAGAGGDAYEWSTQETTQAITVAPSDNTTYTVTVTNSFGCTTSDNATVTVDGIRAVDAVVCIGDTATLTALGGTDYLWSTGETTATIKVFTLDTLMLTLTGSTSGQCGTFDEVYVYPIPATNPVFALPDTFCSNNEDVLLDDYVNPTGGTFTGTGVQGNMLVVQSVNPGGPFDLFYNYSDPNGCSAQLNEPYSVIVAATVSLDGLTAEYCTNDAVVLLEGAPQGGLFNGEGIAGNLFVPYFAGAGEHIISYEFEAANGCISYDNDTIIVHEIPQVVFYMQDVTFCEDETQIILSAIPSGGAFSGQGVTDSIFNPEAAGVGGPYLINYTFTDSNNCVVEANNVVVVNEVSELTILNVASSYCIDIPSVALNALPQGGTFTGNGVSNNQLVPSVAGLGNDTITYTYINGFDCTSSIFTVTEIVDTPQVSFIGLDTAYCNNESSVVLMPTPEGGAFSGDGISGNVFAPASVTPGGPYAITYTYSDVNGCSNITEQNVFVNEAPEVTLSGLAAQYCETDAEVALDMFPEDGILTGAGISVNKFYPSVAGVGTHIIRYEYLSANGCFDYADVTVVVVNCSGIEEIENFNIQVYPNPASTSINIQSVNLQSSIKGVKLFDITGKQLLSAECSGNCVADVSALPEGMYLLHIELSNGAIVMRKVMKQ